MSYKLKDWRPNTDAERAASLPEAKAVNFNEKQRGFMAGRRKGKSKANFANLAAELDMDEQPDWLCYWEFFDRLQPHKSGKKVVCGHTAQASGLIKDVGFALCLDTGPASGGWLTCLDVTSGNYWQATEKRNTRTGTLGK